MRKNVIKLEKCKIEAFSHWVSDLDRTVNTKRVKHTHTWQNQHIYLISSSFKHLDLTSVSAGQKTVTLQSQCSQTIQPSQHASGHVTTYGPPWAPRRGITILHKGCGTNWNSWCHGEWSFWLPSEHTIPSITHRLTGCQNGVLGAKLWCSARLCDRAYYGKRLCEQ